MKPILYALLFACFSATAQLNAAVPSQIHYQGRLTDAQGDPVNATVSMTVRMYDAASGGTLLYEEVIGSVELADGVYSFSFGEAGTRTTSGSEVILTTNGVNQFFAGTLNVSPIDGTVAVSDGVYNWSQSGGSSSTDFSVSYTHATKAVQVTYLAGIPEAGLDLTATYDFIDISEIFASMTASEHWLALMVDGLEADIRTRLLAVPYAMKARESADAQVLAAKMESLLSELRANNLIAPANFVIVEGGTLVSSNELNGTVVDTFYIGKHEVTWGEWQEVRVWATANGYDSYSVGAGCAEDHPVHSVSWYDVVKWCNAKSEQEGLTPVYTVSGATYKSGWPFPTTIVQDLTASGYRLPLEAEWEFAARGGNQSNGYTYSGSNDLIAVGWYYDNSGGAACNLLEDRGTWPVGQKAANELGLHEMSGNVLEWCWDANGSSRRRRGGNWNDAASECTVSYRWQNSPDFTSNRIGFRLARSPGR
ncbi:formylglycine-generating enzyme family protein [Puniceicoccales bacterium CK1056]|uniref:Formylglycine-generating enzyme family protein n=1 Tax=Oceanipulchritudo coccoides TaxID=2706888 RepID=A0A6B2LYR4_9BACT|nr:SUMF1/EgtB/PvdO family nonheme iron enzyme [Oceanipulchritudo coccoides]NDV61074.1 formylglycine-generating enzyme family protein [Oceanipulchritudo coccoides]